MGALLTRRPLVALLVACQALVATGTLAGTPGLPQPTEAVILTVSGRISIFNRGDTAQFDRPMLEALGTRSFTTTTPWHDGPVTFEGVPMTRLMQAVGAQGDTVTALALNDYATDIPMDDFARYGVLLALKRDGHYMPVRDKGPLFIVYPYGSDPNLRSRRFYSRSPWQVAQLIVR
jgi:hypothetical protein